MSNANSEERRTTRDDKNIVNVLVLVCEHERCMTVARLQAMAVLGTQNSMTLLVIKFATESSTRQNSIPFIIEQYILSWLVAILELWNLHISVGLVYTDFPIRILYKITVAYIGQTIRWLRYELDKGGIWVCVQPGSGGKPVFRPKGTGAVGSWGWCYLHLASRITMRTAVSSFEICIDGVVFN